MGNWLSIGRHNKDEEDLTKHTEEYKREWIVTRLAACTRTWKGAYLTASDGLDCKQNWRFKMPDVCHHNILVYIAAPHPTSTQTDRCRIALACEFHKANPSLTLEKRSPFLECRWPLYETYPGDSCLSREQVTELIRNHLMLCDFVEAQVLEESESGDQTDQEHAIPPAHRAIFMLIWMAPVDSEVSLGHAAIVRTGDHDRLASGPINFESLYQHQLPGFASSNDNDQVVYVSLTQAAQFFTQLDQKENAANLAFRTRNEKRAKDVRRQIDEEARERVLLSRQGLRTEIAEGFIRREEDAKFKKGGYKEFAGYSDLQAGFASRFAVFQLDM